MFNVIEGYKMFNLTDKEADIDIRDIFEKEFPMPTSCIRCGNGYAATSYGAWGAHHYVDKFEGYLAGRASMKKEYNMILDDAIDALTNLRLYKQSQQCYHFDSIVAPKLYPRILYLSIGKTPRKKI